MSLKKFTKALNTEGVEGELVKTIFYSLLSSIVLLAILYYSGFKFVPDFFPKYGLFILLSMVGYSLMLAIIRQVRAYKEFPCMSGMMIGMTIGMIAGFLPGFFVGAVNGMFWGSMFGILIGVLFGAWNGQCCGIMGVMEGIMAGFMGGLMGAMSSVMMINDHLAAAGVVVTIVCSVILIGLSYMIYKETNEREREKHESQLVTILVSTILIAATSLFIVFGPRGGIL